VTIKFSHPTGQHDDVFWALALAVFATVEMLPEDMTGVMKFG